MNPNELANKLKARYPHMSAGVLRLTIAANTDSHQTITKQEPMKKRSKFGAVKTVVDGITFSSKAEASRYQNLKIQERLGAISLLTLQPSFELIVNGYKICSYVADFRYRKAGQSVIEDCKGFKTPVYRLKKKLMKAIYGIEIYESK